MYNIICYVKSWYLKFWNIMNSIILLYVYGVYYILYHTILYYMFIIYTYYIYIYIYLKKYILLYIIYTYYTLYTIIIYFILLHLLVYESDDSTSSANRSRQLCRFELKRFHQRPDATERCGDGMERCVLWDTPIVKCWMSLLYFFS